MHWRWILVVVYFVIGFYLINSSQSFIAIPELISQFDAWILLFGGILVVFSGIGHAMAHKDRDKQTVSVR
ncbi:hypothetical protein HYT24_02805 [Candidatus Pacearchaeota archaeon]|nr:hypothetical protein [Candidatus Pacearchaeota archaeon]